MGKNRVNNTIKIIKEKQNMFVETCHQPIVKGYLIVTKGTLSSLTVTHRHLGQAMVTKCNPSSIVTKGNQSSLLVTHRHYW
jgi:hypothetical protein